MTGTGEDTTSAGEPRGGQVQKGPIAAPPAAARAGRPGVALGAGARTPEELETLFEDTLLLHDHHALAELFEEGAVLVAGTEQSARGGEAIAHLALALWAGNQRYVAAARHVIQARNIALVIAEQGITVVRRGRDGAWRFVIAGLFINERSGRREP